MATHHRDHLLKILLMGDANAGKASILLNSASAVGERIAACWCSALVQLTSLHCSRRGLQDKGCSGGTRRSENTNKVPRRIICMWNGLFIHQKGYPHKVHSGSAIIAAVIPYVCR